MSTIPGGQSRLLFTGNVKTNLVNKYTAGTGVGAINTSSRRALKRRATSSAGSLDVGGNLIPGKPCCSLELERKSKSISYSIEETQIPLYVGDTKQPRITNNPNIQYLYPDDKKQTIVFMYSDFISPIRNELAIPIIKTLLKIQGQDNNINVIFLNLIRSSPEIDAANLELLYQYGNTIYLSSLGSSVVGYLSDIFFSKKPAGVMHINAFSTAKSLIGTPNLMRLYAPDLGNIPVFTTLCPFENVLIIKGDGSWADGLSSSIQIELEQASKIVSTYTIPNDMFNRTVTTQYDEILSKNYNDANVTIIIISDFAKQLTVDLNNLGYFTKNVNNFKLVYGDTTPTTAIDDTLFDLFTKGDAGVLLQLITKNDIELQIKLNTSLNAQYVGSDVVLNYSMINIASNLYDIPLADRSKYSIAAKMTFNSTKDNATAYYALVGWATPETTYIKTIFLTETNSNSKISVYKSDIVA